MPRRSGFHDYWVMKTFCEEFVAKTYPKSTIIRPGLITGPHDQNGYFTYWARRIALGGTVLAPGSPTDPIQYIDARDMAEFVVPLAEKQATGVFNVMGPDKPLTVGEMLSGIKAVTTAGAQFEWVPAKFLISQTIAEWTDMPIWVDPAGAWGGLHTMSAARAIAAGLQFRSLADTAKDVLATTSGRPRSGIPPEREAAVLAAWAAEKRAGRG